MKPDQKKYLNDRIDVAVRRKFAREADRDRQPRPPKSVTRARNVIKRWTAKIDRDQRAAYQARQRATSKLRELVLFAEPAKAIRAIKAFERSAV